jgi:hypothetical protein
MSASQPAAGHNLLIATSNAIHIHSRATKTLLFECATPDGILNARAAKDNSPILAVADSHLVILYDAQRGRHRKYKLKSGDVSNQNTEYRVYWIVLMQLF